MSDTTLSARRAHTRERLMDAALEVFAEKGVLAATVEEICERAGFSRGAFYSNYESKDDLCSAAFTRFATDAEQSIRAAVAVVPPDVGNDADISRIVDAALDIAMNDVISSPTRILAQLEIRLHFLRNPHSGVAVPPLNAIDAMLVEVLDVELLRVKVGLRFPTAQVIELLGCILEAQTLRGTDQQAIRALMADTLKCMILHPSPGTECPSSGATVTTSR